MAIRKEYNIITGEIKEIELTQQEIDEAKIRSDEEKIKQDLEIVKESKKASGKQKLIDLGLNEDEIQALIGV